jgi:hypothetical protein
VPTKLQRELSLFLYVDEAFEVAERAIDHLIEAATRASRPAGVCRLVLHASPSQSRTRALATARGFRSTTLTGRRLPQLVKICIPEVLSSRKWDSLRRELAVVSDLHLPPKMPSFDDVQRRGLLLARAATSEQFSVDFFSAETLFSPGLVLYPGRSGVIVPIQEHYAEELLGAVRQ